MLKFKGNSGVAVNASKSLVSQFGGVPSILVISQELLIEMVLYDHYPKA